MPDQVYGHLADGVGARGRRARDEWMTTFERYRAAHPQLAEQLYRMQHRTLPDGWDAEDRRASLDRPVCHVM